MPPTRNNLELFTDCEDNKIYWNLMWGLVDGVQLTFDFKTKAFILEKEGCEQEFTRGQAVSLLYHWKLMVKKEHHYVIPWGFHGRLEASLDKNYPMY